MNTTSSQYEVRQRDNGQWGVFEVATGRVCQAQPTQAAAEAWAQMLQKQWDEAHPAPARPATTTGRLAATPRQIDYAWSLTARIARDTGIEVGQRGFDGEPLHTLEQIKGMAKGEASAYISRLVDRY